jgi:hypothetical protein
MLKMMKKNIKWRGRIMIVILFLSLVILLNFQSSPIQTAQAASSTFTEDFTTTTYMDGGETNTSGWGTGDIENSMKKPSIIGSISSTLIGNVIDVFVDGDYAYVTNQNDGLKIVNITDPSNPHIIGTYDTAGTAQSVFVSGEYAFIADGAGDAFSINFLIINITDPTNPISTGNCTTYGTARDVVVKENYAFIANDASGLCIVDITDPTEPSRADWIDTLGTSLELIISGNYAYVADGVNGLVIVDVTDPLIPNIEATFNTGISSATSIAVEDYHAYIVDFDNGVTVVNVADSTTPIFKSLWSKSGVSNAYMCEKYLYVTDINDGLSILDITDPNDPIFINTLTLSGITQEIVIDDIYAYLACQSGGFQIAKIIDIIPTYLDSYNTPDNAWSVEVSGDYAYVADESGGLQIIDISNPLEATYVSDYTTPHEAKDVLISGIYAYIADHNSGLQILNISDPTTPTFVGSYNTPSLASALTISDNLVYIADGAGGLQILNITDPTTPTFVGSYNTPSYAYGVFVDGFYAYIADGSGGLLILNITDPTTPTFVDTYVTPDMALDVIVSETYAFVSVYQSGLLILDISDPTTPTYFSSFDAYDMWGPWEIDFSGDYACLANGNTGLQVLDLSNLSSPSLVGSYNTPGVAQGVFFSGDYAYVADGNSGLQIIKVRTRRVDQYNSVCLAQSTSVFTASYSIIENATIFTNDAILSSTAISYYLSADNGINWETITPGIKHDFTSTGSLLKWKAVLTTSVISNSPVIHNLSIEYTTKLANPSLLTPTDGFITEDYTPTFTWNEINSEANYLFQLDTTISFTSPLMNITLPSSSTSYTPSSPLTEDTYYWRVAGIDSEGDIGDFSNYRTLYLILDVNPPTMNNPSDVSYEQGTTGNSITWTPADSNPYWYNITLNGILTSHDDSWLGGNIVMNINGLALGTHTVICYVYDLEGLVASDIVEVEVTTTAPPTIDDVLDFDYEEGSTGNSISWHPSDANPDYYSITRDGIIIDDGSWLGGDISINIDGLAYSVYTYVCFVNDTEGQSASDSVVITVTDIVAPIINAPSDVIYEEGTTGNNIVWIATDNNPATYIVYRDGIQVETNSWTSGSSIIISVDGLVAASYNYTIVVFDEAGNSAQNEVTVAVTPTVPEFSQSVFLAIISITLVSIFYYIKRRTLKKG